MKRLSYVAGLVAACIAFLLPGYALAQPTIGEAAPDFTLLASDGYTY